MGKRKEITGKDNGKQKMWTIITVIIVFFAMAGYAGMSYYYSDRFFRGTTINGINCSGKTSEEAEQAVAKKAEDYLLEVKARNLKSQSINGKLIGYRYVSDGSISQYLDEQKPYKWVRGFWKKQNYTAKENMTYDKVKLKEQLEKLECVKKENQTAPEDAYVAYKDSKFEIVPETEGNTLDFNGAYQALSEAITDKKRTITLLMQIYSCAKEGAQFIIVTHSPILLGIPDADIYCFDDGRIHLCEYEETESYRVTEMFINNRQMLLDKLLTD